MSIWTAIILVAILGAIFLFVRRRGDNEDVRPDERRKADAMETTKFHAVSIKFAPDSCAAAKRMDGRRYLSSAAPRLPLPECDVLECKCRFVHHSDRRRGSDRRSPFAKGFGSASTGKYEKEQRKGRERRDEAPEDYFG